LFSLNIMKAKADIGLFSLSMWSQCGYLFSFF